MFKERSLQEVTDYDPILVKYKNMLVCLVS
jgi:hypothetical protein